MPATAVVPVERFTALTAFGGMAPSYKAMGPSYRGRDAPPTEEMVTLSVGAGHARESDGSG